MLRPKGPPALTSTTSSTLALTSFFVTLLTEVSVNDLLVTVSVVTPIWMGGAGGSLDMSSRTLSSLLGVTAAAAVGVARETERPEGPEGPEGPGEDSLFEFSLLLKTPDSPWSLPRLEVDEVPRAKW